MISLLTYNVCWEALEANKGNIDMTWCKCNDKNLCLKSIGDTINKLTKDGLIDFFCLQEIMENSQWDNLKPRIKGLDHYKWKFCSPTQKSGIATFWNTKKYTLIDEKCGDLMDKTISNSTGRPYQILVFKEGFIVVNIHFPHIEQLFGNSLMPIINKLKTKLGEISEFHNPSFNTIIMGDFNTEDAPNLISQIDSQRFFYKYLPSGATCCSPIPHLGSISHIWKSDLIFTTIAKPLEYITIKSDTKYTSDHLPVLQIIAR